jgi:hypothetical protein
LEEQDSSSLHQEGPSTSDLTSTQQDFVTLGNYPEKYPVQKGGEPEKIMVTRSGKSRPKHLMPGGLAMGCSLDYTWDDHSNTWNRFATPFESRVDDNDEDYKEAKDSEWYLEVSETAGGTEYVQVPYDGGNKRNRDDGAPKTDEEAMRPSPIT